MSDHPCPNEKMIESHGRDIDALFAQGRDREARMTEMETVLYGAERQGGNGFIKETRETMEIVRAGVSTLSNQVKELGDYRAMKQSRWTQALPAVIGLVSALAVAIATKVL